MTPPRRTMSIADDTIMIDIAALVVLRGLRRCAAAVYGLDLCIFNRLGRADHALIDGRTDRPFHEKRMCGYRR